MWLTNVRADMFQYNMHTYVIYSIDCKKNRVDGINWLHFFIEKLFAQMLSSFSICLEMLWL